MSWQVNLPSTIAHCYVAALTDDAESGFFQGIYGSLMINTGDSRHSLHVCLCSNAFLYSR